MGGGFDVNGFDVDDADDDGFGVNDADDKGLDVEENEDDDDDDDNNTTTSLCPPFLVFLLAGVTSEIAAHADAFFGPSSRTLLPYSGLYAAN